MEAVLPVDAPILKKNDAMLSGMAHKAPIMPVTINDLLFMFPSRLSFRPLIQKLQKVVAQPQVHQNILLAEEVLTRLQAVPALMEVIDDLSLLDEHASLISILMSTVFPVASSDAELRAAVVPFHMKPFFATPGFAELITLSEDEHPQILNYSEGEMCYFKMVMAYHLILNHVYGLNSEPQFPPVFTLPDPRDGLNRHYQLNLNHGFTEIKTLREPATYSPEKLEYFRKNMHNLELMRKYFPPENFEFQGFTLINLIDITEQKVLSSLKDELLERDALISDRYFKNIQDRMRDLLRLPALRLGLAAFNSNQNPWQSKAPAIWNSFVFQKGQVETSVMYQGCIYDQTLQRRQPYVVEDLENYDKKTQVEEALRSQGVKSLLVAPLIYNDELVGILELGSSKTGDLDAYSLSKLMQVLPLFSLAVKRSIENVINEVERIKQKELRPFILLWPGNSMR
ncbi:MAG: GAF domain-containing protein [Bacteroidia bacterium]|nr:GAF domain-containing protein [Bacteroidia bacterium]